MTMLGGGPLNKNEIQERGMSVGLINNLMIQSCNAMIGRGKGELW